MPRRSRSLSYDSDVKRKRYRSPEYRSDDAPNRSSKSFRDRDRDRNRDRNRDRDYSHSSPGHHRDRDYLTGSQEQRHDDTKKRHTKKRDSSSEDDRRRKKREKREKERNRKDRDKVSEHRSYREQSTPPSAPAVDPALSAAAMGYTAENNPFGDSNLDQKFTWVKKQDKLRKQGFTSQEVIRREQEKRTERMIELEKLNKRRTEREIEQELREQEQTRIQRELEEAQMGDWRTKENEFHLEQAKKRAEIRIKEGRAKPIDILAMNLRLANENDKQDDEELDIELEIDMDEPYTIFDNLTSDEVKELYGDIQMYLQLERNEENLQFWRAMIVVADDAIAKVGRDEARARAGGVAEAIDHDILQLLSNKTYDQLVLLQNQIQKKLASGQPMDVEYWEHLFKNLTVWKAKARLRDMHQVLLTRRLEQLRKKQREEAIRVQIELEQVMGIHSGVQLAEGSAVPGEGREIKEEELAAEADMDEMAKEDDDADGQLEAYDRSMSPVPFERLSKEDRSLEIIDEMEDRKALKVKREEVLDAKIITVKKEKRKPDDQETELDVSKILYDKEAAKFLDEEEELFNVEAELAKQTYLWQDKYRPRKPRYFNRVHTGYEWNKYNQTHYDSDNPPPKVVQGYRMNIFYPDLIDKSVAPTYTIEKEPGTDETVLIRFHAGPPYEDIAFRIVNREWEYSHKRGFKCSFDRGVLQLFFHFKRHFYRK